MMTEDDFLGAFADEEFADAPLLRRRTCVDDVALALPTTVVAPRTSAHVSVGPQYVFKGESLVLLEEARGLKITVLVGCELDVLGLPAELFIPRLVEGAFTKKDVELLCSDEGLRDFGRRLMLAMPLRLSASRLGNLIIFDVENPTDLPRVFDGALLGKAVRSR